VTVAAERAEELRTRFVELAPEGFEEAEHTGEVELAAYGEAAERVLAAFPGAIRTQVEPGWEHRWREFHRPVRVGPLWIGPPWEAPPTDALAIVVDPGLAFGTGAHPTTRLCLELLLDLPRGSVLDVGCGSGVLAIAAVRLGFGPVTALDTAEAAVDATAVNAAANGVAVDVRRADALADRLPAAQVVLANIDRAAILALGTRLEAGHAVTSGYLRSDPPPVPPGYEHAGRRERGGWAADLFERGADPAGWPRALFPQSRCDPVTFSRPPVR
jgi:ribosomal protein L11 methyltransferase